jgi:uncharacterized repeat protein (TIGR01451 family)
MKNILVVTALLAGISFLPAASPMLTMTSSFAPQIVQDDGTVVFAVQVRNEGDAPASNVVLSNSLPAGVIFLGSVPGPSGVNGNTAIIPLSNLAPGAFANAVITGRVSNVSFGANENVLGTNESVVTASALPSPVIVVLPVPIFTRRDFGDAPDPTYPVLLASNGARHRTNALFLGSRVDSEPDGQPSPMAYDDDTGGADDEDGVALPPFFTIGGIANVTVTVSTAGVLDAWADFNADGDWFDGGEHVIIGAPVPAGSSVIAIPVPAWTVAGNSYLRFRISPNGTPAPIGFVNGGEVEDYVIEMRPPSPPVASGIVKLEPRNGHMRVSWDRPNALLQVAPTVNGPWSTLADAVSPFELPPNTQQRFFRVIESRNASRSGLGKRTFASMARDADLIIDAVVTGIAYRNSDGDGSNTVSWPHTFVTVQVLDVLKGRLAGTNLCLRFLGGLDADGDRVLNVSHMTRFDVGERSILFVRRNNFVARPLVGGSDGRLRIVNGMVYSEHGQRLVLTPTQRLAFGEEDDLEEMHQDIVGTNLMARVHSEAQGELPPSPRPTGDHLTVTLFKTALMQIIQQNHTLQELQNPVLTLCADPARNFRMPRPRERPGPFVPPAGLAGAPVQDDEVARVKANGGNPVLK